MWSGGGIDCRLDHEADLAAYRKDLEDLLRTFIGGDREEFGSHRHLFRAGGAATQATLDSIRWFENAVQQGDVTSATAMDRVIGQGHHRVLAVKE